MKPGDNILEAVQHRLFGSANRIAWRSEDVSAVMARMGVSGVPASKFVASSSYRPAPVITSTKAAAAPDNQRTFTFTISTSDVDRMGDTISISGWKLGAYQRAPVVLWSHLGTLLPVGRAIKLWTEGNRLKATAELAPADMNPDAERVRKMLAGGFLKATSVGFIPLAFKFSEDPSRKYGIDFLSQELCEFSIVNVAANSLCVLDAKSAASGAKTLRTPHLDEARRTLARLRSSGTAR